MKNEIEKLEKFFYLFYCFVVIIVLGFVNGIGVVWVDDFLVRYFMLLWF